MKVFVNTLERFADRKLRMKSLLDSLGIPFEFFEGPDGKKLTQAEIDAAYDDIGCRKNINRAMTRSEIGCAMAHRAMYRKMIDENIVKACILEDDILVDEALPKVLAFLDAGTSRNTVVKLDNYREKNSPCSIWGRRRIDGEIAYKKPVTTQWMTWGYVLDRSAAESLLRASPKIRFVCDDWDRMGTAVDIRCVQPAVVHRNATLESNLEEGRSEAFGTSLQPKGRGGPIKRLLHIARTIALMLFS